MADQPGRATRRDVASQNSNPNGFQGLWSGVVVDDLDPLKIGRVRLRVFELHDEETPVAELPWALPCFPSAFMNVSDPTKSGGFFQVPPIDAVVHVMFQKGDPEFPIWMGGWFPKEPGVLGREKYKSNGDRKALYNADGRPSCPTWRSLRGHVIELDDEVPELRITSANGHKITLSDGDGEQGDAIKLEDHEGNYIWMDTGRGLLSIRWDGDVKEHITGNKEVIIGGNLLMTVGGNHQTSADGDITHLASGQMSLDALMINLNGGLAQEPTIAEAAQGDASAGDSVGEVLKRLGNTIRKILTGS